MTPDKLVLMLTVILAVVALSAWGAIEGGAADGAGQPIKTAVSQNSQDEGEEAGEAKDDNGEAKDENEAGEAKDENEAGEAKDSDDEALTGSVAQEAAEAALAATGGGTVIDAERDEDGAAYKVEVRKLDGSEVKVRLDSQFKVLQTVADD